MPEYEIKMTLTVVADDKIQAFDKVKGAFNEKAWLAMSDEMNTDLFSELGIEI